MTAVRALNLKGLGYEERDERLFPALEQLRTGESLEVTMEVNPSPLANTLKTIGEFGVSCRNAGPAEWVLELTRTAQPADKKEQLKELVRMLRQERLSPAGREQAGELLKVLDPPTLGILEQELIREGITQEQVRSHLRDIHLQTLQDDLAARRIEVASPHPVHTLMEEHRAILASLNALGALIERLRGRDSFADAGEEVRLLPEMVRTLLEAENHHQREEQVIFPHLEEHGIQEPPAVMRADHAEFRSRTVRLALLSEAARQSSEPVFADWRREVVGLGEHLSRELASHILREDNILYQLALQAFDREEWEQVKRECDRIGYCCFTPPEVRRANAVQLDMRSVPMLQRQGKIMEAWKELPSGGVLRLVNDREPKPLHFLFQATQRGRFEWSYEQRGPAEWVAAIRKL